MSRWNPAATEPTSGPAAGPVAGPAAPTGPRSAPVGRRRLLQAAAATVVVAGAGGAAAYAYLGTKKPAALKWRFATGVLDRAPAVADGVVYAGGQDGRLFAIDAATGAEKWSFDAGGGITSTPALGNGMVYVGNVHGYLIAVDAVTGAQRWRFDTGAGLHGCDAVFDTTFGGTTVLAVDLYGTLTAVDTKSGTSLWSFQAGDTALKHTNLPVVYGGFAFVVGTDGHLYQVSLVGGSSAWHAGGGFTASPTPYKSSLVVADVHGILHSLDMNAGGGEKWNYSVPALPGITPDFADHTGAPIISGDNACVVAYTPCAVNAETGAPAWQYQDTSEGAFAPSLAQADGVLYTCAGNKLHALDAATGTAKWTFAVSDHTASTVAVAGKSVLVGGSDGNLFAISMPT